jgi:hypothetical protein
MKITCSASPLGKLTAPPTTEKKIPNVLWGWKARRNFTFRGPCFVIYSCNKTNEMH